MLEKKIPFPIHDISFTYGVEGSTGGVMEESEDEKGSISIKPY